MSEEPRKVKDWLDELEGFSTRRERVPDGAIPWIVEAFNLGRQSAMEPHTAPYRSADYLTDPEMILAYLEEAFSSREPEMIEYAKAEALVAMYRLFPTSSVRDLRQRLIGGVEGVKRGRDLTIWAETNDKWLRETSKQDVK